MARTVQNIIDQVKDQRFKWMTQTEGVQFVNDTHKELIGLLPALRRTPFSTPYTVTVVAGTREYILPLALNQIERVEFTPTAGTPVQLAPKTIEYINRGITVGNKDDIWLRETVQAAPTAFYHSCQSTGNFIGLDTLPSVGGTLYIYGSDISTLIASDQLLPMFSDEVYIEGVSYRLMKSKKNGALAVGYKSEYQSLLSEVKNWKDSFLEGQQNTGKEINAREG